MSANTQANGWTEPPWCGWIETTGDALLILEAARRGVIPRVTRRLVDSERKMITSGSVFVFDEDESGIKRWTDGLFWSPSRILGNFLLYRETDKRGTSHRRVEPQPQQEAEPQPSDAEPDTQSLARPKSDPSRLGIDRQRERVLVGSLTNTYKFKPNGLMKKTFSLTIGGVSQHLISYYRVEDVESGRLRTPSSIPELSSLQISPEYLDKTHFRNPPKVEIGQDGVPRYCGESDEGADSSPRLVPASLSNARALPLLTEVPIADDPDAASPKRSKSRYEPYAPAAAPAKRVRRKQPSGSQAPSSPEDSAHSPGNSPVSPYADMPQQLQYPGFYPAQPAYTLDRPSASGAYAYPASTSAPVQYGRGYPDYASGAGEGGGGGGGGGGGNPYPYFPQYPGYAWQHQYTGFPSTQPASLPPHAVPRAADEDGGDGRSVEA